MARQKLFPEPLLDTPVNGHTLTPVGPQSPPMSQPHAAHAASDNGDEDDDDDAGGSVSTASGPAKRQKSGDVELLTMARVQRQLDSLDEDAAARVVAWIYDRWRGERLA
jgi:hypothetical protein